MRFLHIYNEAVIAFQQGNHRKAATKYLESFDASVGGGGVQKWNEYRWQILHGYTSILKEEYFSASMSDLEALNRICNDKSEVKLYRVEAAFTSGLLWWIKNNREECAEFYRIAIRLADKAPDKERKKKVLATIATPDGNGIAGVGPKLIGDIIDDVGQEANSNLKQLQEPNFCSMSSNGDLNVPPSSIAHQKVRSDGTFLPPAARATGIAFGPLSTTLTQEQAERLLTVGGERCDCCNKSRRELGLKHLLNCARCKKTYYCGKECQRKQWTAGHKELCRKPGQIKPGDYVRLNAIQSKPEINGQVVEVVKEDAQTEGRWEVRIPGGDRSISIAAAKMEQLRPLK